MEPNITQMNIEKKSFMSAKKLIILLLVLLVVALGSSVYFYQKANPSIEKDAEKELAQVIKMVSRHIVLPVDEKPTMATVSDPEKLKDQAFFAHAKKGDKVLIFTLAGKAILYDPEEDKIIEVAPINANSVPK